MSTSLPPPAPAHVLTADSERETAAAIAGLVQTAREAAAGDAELHGPDALDGYVQAVAAGTPAREVSERQRVLAVQRQERATAQERPREAQARVAALEGYKRGWPVPPGVRVKLGPGLIIVGLLVGAILGAEMYILKGPFDTLLSTGGGFSWPALGIAAVMTVVAALSGHFRASARQEHDALPPGASRARDGLHHRISGLTVLLVAESVMAFTARAYDASYGTGSYLNAATLAYGLVQLVFFLSAMTLPGVLLRMHDVATEAAVRNSLTEAKVQQSAAADVVVAVEQTHADQLERLRAARREVTLTYVASLAAATYGVPAMGDRIRGLMPLVREDGTLPPVTRPGGPQQTSRQRPQADDPDDGPAVVAAAGPGDGDGGGAPRTGYQTAAEMFEDILAPR